MKRGIIVISFILTAILLTSCSQWTVQTTTWPRDPVSVPTTIATKATTPSTTKAPTKAPTPRPTTTTTTTAQIGSRSLPAPLGTPLIITSESRTYTAEQFVALTKVIRGEEAKKIVIKENRFNDIPDGKEVVLVWVEFQLNKYVPNDENDEYSLSSWDFEFYNSKSTMIDSDSLVIPDELSGEMFEGGSASGYIYAIVDPDQTVYVRYLDIAWFALE